MSITLTALQKQRTDTAANWTSANPTLLSGELGFESDTGKMKLGNGSTAWNSLAYLILIPSSGVYPGTQLIMPAGTNALPSLTFVGDTNTGIYSSGADEVSVATAGANRLFIGSDGRVGVGMQSPDRRLVIQHTGTADIGLYGSSGTVKTFINASATNGNIGTTTNHDFNFYTNANVRAVIKADGKVGIGTSAPGYKVEIAGTSGSAVLGLLETGVRSWGIRAGGALTNTFDIADFTAGVTRLTIDSSGRVGIGTATPGAELSVVGDIRSTGSFNTSASNYIFSYGGGAVGAVRSGLYLDGTNTVLSFFTAQNERARIDSSGRLLVGTSSTSDVARAVFTGNSSAPTGNSYVLLARGGNTSISNGTNLGNIGFADSSHVASAYIGAFADSGTWTSGSSQPTRLAFSTTADGASSPTERMRIGNDGYVYINQMAVGGTANMHWSSSAGQLFVTSSSLRFKKDIVDYDKGLAEVMQMQPKYFVYNQEPGGKRRAGFIAEDFHDLGLNEYVEYWKGEEGEDLPSEIGYSNMVAILVKAIQELKAEVDDLKSQLA